MEHHKYSDRRSSHVGSAIAAVGDTSGAMERKKTISIRIQVIPGFCNITPWSSKSLEMFF